MGNLCGKEELQEVPSPAYYTFKGKQARQISPDPNNKENRSPNVLLTREEEEAQDLRRKATNHAKQRNEFFEKSQAAFKSGDGALAKDLSEQGKLEQIKMDEANHRAAELIFFSKNRSQPPDTIDLHMLFVDEAIMRTTKRIEDAQKHKENHLVIVHGAGNHSANHVQLLKPAVVKLLNEKGLKFKENKPNVGCIYVELWDS